jgi:vacuolar protein 8
MTSLCCGCFSRKQNKKSKSNDLYEPLLLDKERDAVNDLLKFLQNDEVSTEITSDRLSALRTLAYSDNVDLQRSAALCFSEISERSRLCV